MRGEAKVCFLELFPAASSSVGRGLGDKRAEAERGTVLQVALDPCFLSLERGTEDCRIAGASVAGARIVEGFRLSLFATLDRLVASGESVDTSPASAGVFSRLGGGELKPFRLSGEEGVGAALRTVRFLAGFPVSDPTEDATLAVDGDLCTRSRGASRECSSAPNPSLFGEPVRTGIRVEARLTPRQGCDSTDIVGTEEARAGMAGLISTSTSSAAEPRVARVCERNRGTNTFRGWPDASPPLTPESRDEAGFGSTVSESMSSVVSSTMRCPSIGKSGERAPVSAGGVARGFTEVAEFCERDSSLCISSRAAYSQLRLFEHRETILLTHVTHFIWFRSIYCCCSPTTIPGRTSRIRQIASWAEK